VIVLKIEIDGIFAIPAERNPPVAAGIHRIAAFLLPLERMKPEAR
jgi:hypothetical protein